MTGRSNSATTSRRMWMLSDSRARIWVRVRSGMGNRVTFVVRTKGRPGGLRYKDSRRIMLKSIGMLMIGTVAFAQDVTVSAQRIREHTRYLSSDQMEGRGVGTRGEKLATEYIANQFALAGAKPAGDNGTWFQ